MSMTATARPVDGTLRHEVDINGRHAIVTDEPMRLGGTDTGPAPYELLPAMLAACVSTTIAAYANARGLELDDLRVDVVYEPEASPRHVELVVHAPAGLTDDQAERLRRIADACPVKRALEAGFTFEETVVDIRPDHQILGRPESGRPTRRRSRRSRTATCGSPSGGRLGSGGSRRRGRSPSSRPA
jgi:putative redox protein